MPAGVNDVFVVAQGLLSAYGRGVSRCADGFLAGQCALRPAEGRGLPPALEKQRIGAIPPDDLSSPSASRFSALLRAGCAGLQIPSDAAVYVATTAGAIGEMEAAVFSGTGFSGQGGFSDLARLAADALGVDAARLLVVSSACASSTAALVLAASAIRRGEIECALVVGCDVVSEFVLSGFASLMAVDPDGAHPFDADRRGVAIGEAVAVALLMRRDRAEREGRPGLGVVAGWGLTCDANHLTGPSRDGAPLADAIGEALSMASCSPDKVGAICAHGTGTAYNDQMETLAFKRAFGETPRPAFSVKGGMGHTMGAAGLAEYLLSLEFLRRGRVPPTVGLRRVSEEAQGWVSSDSGAVDSSAAMLTTNSGFGGTNAAVVLSLAPLARNPLLEKADISLQRIGEGRAAAADASQNPGAPAAMPRNFSRFSPEVRTAFFAATRALEAAGIVRDGGMRIGVIACDREGSERANFAYFDDYVRSGRVLGRGQLFVYTLPTSVAAECAIACRLTGPLLYVAGSGAPTHGAEAAARGLLADGLADAVLVLSSNPKVARATVWTAARIQAKELP